MKKKVLCILLSISMLAVFMPAMAFADEGPFVINNFSDLQNYLKGHEEGQVATFACDIQCEQDILLEKGINTLNLKGYKLDLNGHRALLGDAVDLSLENGTVSGGLSTFSNTPSLPNGGSIYAIGNANLTLKDITITGCQTVVPEGVDVKYPVGAVALSDNAKLLILGTTVIDQNTVNLPKVGKLPANVDSASNQYVALQGLKKQSKVSITTDYAAHPKSYLFSDEQSLKYVACDYKYPDGKKLAFSYVEGSTALPQCTYTLQPLPEIQAATYNANTELYKLALGYDNDECYVIYEQAIEAVKNANSVEEIAQIVANAKDDMMIAETTERAVTIKDNLVKAFENKALLPVYQSVRNILQRISKSGPSDPDVDEALKYVESHQVINHGLGTAVVNAVGVVAVSSSTIVKYVVKRIPLAIRNGINEFLDNLGFKPIKNY